MNSERASCAGFIDSHGTWNTGFECPKWGENDEDNCCGDEHKRFCCPPPDKHHFHRRKKLKSDVKKEIKDGTSEKYDEKRMKQNEKQNLFPRYPIHQKPKFDETIETSTPLLQITHSTQGSALPLNIIHHKTPLVLALCVTSAVMLLLCLLVCCCCYHRKKKKKKTTNNYIKTTSVSMEAEVTSAAIAAQALVMMPSSESFCEDRNPYNNNQYFENCTTNNMNCIMNNLYNHNVGNVSNNTISTTSSMSALCSNLSCKGLPNLQLTKEPSALTCQNHYVHKSPDLIQSPQAIMLNNLKNDKEAHWQELENMLVKQEAPTKGVRNETNELSTSITGWLPHAEPKKWDNSTQKNDPPKTYSYITNDDNFLNFNNCSTSFHANLSQQPPKTFSSDATFSPLLNGSLYNKNIDGIENKQSLNQINYHHSKHNSNIQMDELLSMKSTLVDIPNCPEPKLTSTWMAMR